MSYFGMFGTSTRADPLTVDKWPLPVDWPFYKMTQDWRTPVVVAVVYAAVATVFSRRNIARGPPPPTDHKQWSLFKVAVIAHNVLLTLFSAKTFFETAPVMLSSFRKNTLYDWFCDIGNRQADTCIGFWTWVFYLSKYYELLDTAILLAKGRPSSFLQTYHHAGAIVGMWMLSATRAFGSWVFVVFNSFIHTVMYTYYTLTCLGFQPHWKRLMTQMQITQFLVGLPIAILYIVIPGCVGHDPERNQLARELNVSVYWSHVIALAFNFLYVSYLIVLFVDFARRTYASKTAAARGRRKAE